MTDCVTRACVHVAPSTLSAEVEGAGVAGAGAAEIEAETEQGPEVGEEDGGTVKGTNM